MRNISLDELEGFREALQELCINVDLSEFNTIQRIAIHLNNKTKKMNKF